MRRDLSFSFLLALSLAACVPPSNGPSHAESATSGYSMSLGSSVSSSGSTAVLSLPSRPDPSDLVVRPDALQLTFALSERGPDPARLLSELAVRTKGVIETIESAGGAAATRMCGTSTSAATGGKVASDEPATYTVRVDGSIEIPLAAGQDYWARSRLVAELSRVTREIAVSSKTAETKYEVAFSQLQPIVKDPEAHRAALLKRWAERVHAFAEAAQSEGSPLSVVDCSPPGSVEQRVVSLEEVALRLPVQCKLDVTRAGGSVPSSAP